MSSGLEFDESMSDPLADVGQMFLNVRDMAAFAAAKPSAAKPGARWQYSRGTTNILCAVLRRHLGDDAFTPSGTRGSSLPFCRRTRRWSCGWGKRVIPRLGNRTCSSAASSPLCRKTRGLLMPGHFRPPAAARTRHRFRPLPDRLRDPRLPADPGLFPSGYGIAPDAVDTRCSRPR